MRMILSDPRLKAMWKNDLKKMRDRLESMRTSFVRALRDADAPGDWSFLEVQVGLFSLIPKRLLSQAHIRRLKDEYLVYMLGSGRISLTGLNENNVGYVAEAIERVLK